VQGRDATELSRTVFGFGKIFVAIQTNRDSDLGFLGSVCGRLSRTSITGGNIGGSISRRGPPIVVERFDDSQNAATATDPHIFPKSNLGGHSQGKFYFSPFDEGHVSKEENSSGADILGEAQTFGCGGNVPQRYGEVESEALSNTAFNTNRWGRHGRVPSLWNRRKKANATLAQFSQSGKSKIRSCLAQKFGRSIAFDYGPA
jgi:hypothetical protein